jgi:hypothetical protein
MILLQFFASRFSTAYYIKDPDVFPVRAIEAWIFGSTPKNSGKKI